MYNLNAEKINPTQSLLYLLVGALPLIFIDSFYSKTELPRYAFISFITLPAVLIFIFTKLKQHSFSLYWHSNLLFFGIFILFSACSIFWSYGYGNYKDEIIKLVVFSLVFFTGTQISNIKSLKMLLYVSIFSASIVSFIGILQKFNLSPFPLSSRGLTGLSASTFINQNFAANYLNLIIPINFILLICSDKKRQVWLLTFTLILLLSHILIMHSRGSWVALIIFFVALLVSSQIFTILNEKLQFFSKHFKAPVLVLFLVPALIFILPGENARTTEAETARYIAPISTYSQSSTAIRKNANLTAFDMIKDKPVLGVGLGNFHIAFQGYARSINSEHKVYTNLLRLHNDSLQIIVELGVIGGGLIFILIGNTLFSAYKSIKNTSNTANLQNTSKLLILGLLLALTASSVHSLVSFPLHQATSGFMFYLWLGLLTGLLSTKMKATEISKYILKATFVLLLFFMFFTFSHYYNYLRSSFHINEAILTFENNNCANSVEHVDKSISYYDKYYYQQSWALSIYAECEKENHNKKLQLTQIILNNNPLHPMALKTAAISHFKLNQYNEAEKVLYLLSILYPAIPATHIELGNVFYKQKKYHQAKNEYIKALKLDAKNILALKMLSKTRLKIKPIPEK